MSAPSLFKLGAIGSGSGAVAYPYPQFNGGEFLLAFIEDANEAVAATPSGWTLLSGTPVGTGTAAGTAATAIRAYYKFAAPGDTPSVTVADLGNHQVGAVFAFENVDATNPFDVAAVTDVAASASTSVTFPSITTTTNDSLVVCLVANATDTATDQGSSFAHAGLTEVASGNFNTTAGNGGGVSYLYGVMGTAGATGTGSCTLATSSVQARLTIALRSNQATSAKLTKANAYAVLGSPDDAASIIKLASYAVLGPEDAFASVTKLVAYAVLEEGGAPPAAARPVVFVCS